MAIDFQCVICKEVRVDMMEVTGCGHLGCSKCLPSWCSSKNTCPVCNRTPAVPRESSFVSNKVPGLDVYCLQKNAGCEFKSTFAHWIEHERQCIKKVRTCPNGCGEKVVAANWKKHQETCSNQAVECNACGEMIPLREYADHQDPPSNNASYKSRTDPVLEDGEHKEDDGPSTASMIIEASNKRKLEQDKEKTILTTNKRQKLDMTQPADARPCANCVRCPADGCNQWVGRTLIERHLTKTCDRQHVQCGICRQFVARGDIQKHIDTGAKQHTQMLQDLQLSQSIELQDHAATAHHTLSDRLLLACLRSGCCTVAVTGDKSFWQQAWWQCKTCWVIKTVYVYVETARFRQ